MSVSTFGATLTVEAAFSAASGSYGVWDVDVWDTATWGPDLVWSDISSYVRSVQTKIGRSRAFDNFQAGTATIVLSNADGRFSAENTTGPYASGGLSGVRPWRPIRINVTDPFGNTYPMFYGFTETFIDEFPGTLDSRTTVTLVDGIALLARYNGFEQPAAGDGESTGARLHRVLDNASWTLPRAIDQSDSTCQATTLAQNAWTESLLTANSDGGDVWVDPDGTFIFEHIGHPFQDTRETTVQATFTDAGSGGVAYNDIKFAHDGDLLVNIAAFARAGGTEQRITDETSRALFGDHLYSRNDFILSTDEQVVRNATLTVQVRSDSEKRVDQIMFHPYNQGTTDPTIWAQLGRRVKDRVRVVRTVPGTAVTLDRQCFIDGVEHTLTPNVWNLTFKLGSATGYPSSTQLGAWDSGLWDTATWGW